MTEHPAIDAEQLVADFEALGFLLRFLVGGLSHLLQRLERSAGEHVHRHVAAAAEGWRELLHHQKDFAIIGAGVVLRFDVDRSRLAGVSAAVEVAPGHDMRVVKAKARGFWHEGDPAHPVRRHERRAFLGGAIDVARDHLPVPVHQLRRIGVIVNIDDDPLPFLEAQQRSRKLAVIERGRDDVIGRQLDQPGSNAQRVVRLFVGDFVGGPMRGAAPRRLREPVRHLRRERRSIMTMALRLLQR